MESRLTVLHRSLGEDRHVSDPCCLGKGDQDSDWPYRTDVPNESCTPRIPPMLGIIEVYY